MRPSPPWRRIPWRTIALVLAGAAVVAWTIGFIAGLLVRFGLGIGR
jgi:ferric-dicitrate binding protein FerR (iron transport regulator)